MKNTLVLVITLCSFVACSHKHKHRKNHHHGGGHKCAHSDKKHGDKKEGHTCGAEKKCEHKCKNKKKHGHKHHHSHEHSGPLHHSFSDAKKWAKMFDDPKRGLWQKPNEVISVLKIQPGMTVADIGAGTGYFLPLLNQSVGNQGKVRALDVEPNLISHIQKRIADQKLSSTTATLIQKDNPGLLANSTDRVLVVDTWHHIESRTDYAQKIVKGLRPGGQLVVVDFEPNAKGPGPKARHRLASDVVRKELEAAGLKVTIAKESLPLQYIVVGTKK